MISYLNSVRLLPFLLKSLSVFNSRVVYAAERNLATESSAGIVEMESLSMAKGMVVGFATLIIVSVITFLFYGFIRNYCQKHPL